MVLARSFLWAVSALFGGLSTYAAYVQMRDLHYRTPCALMIAGGVALLCAVFSDMGDRDAAEVMISAACGCVMICAAAMWNGKRSGNFHIRHHIIRIVLCVFILAGFFYL